MASLLIKNGRLIDPANGIDGAYDLLVKDGVVDEVSEHITAEADEVIDASGLWVMPGFIDLHVHLREPGFESKETIATGTRAAAMGGVTTICAMPNTNPVSDNEILITYIKVKAEREGVVNVLPIGAITKGQKGEEFADIGKMAEAGACAISEDGRSVDNAALMQTAMRYSKMFNLPVFDHCEDARLAGTGCMNAGDRAALLGLKGINNASEEVMVSRDIILADSVKAKLHLCHMSTAGSVQLIREAKARGVQVTAEAAPHHFTLCDEDINDYDANYKMNPPLRSAADREAIREALRDNIIEVIATDHAPHHLDDKNCEFGKAANGITGLETSFALGVSELVEGGYLTPSGLVEKMSVNPAKVLGCDKGQLSVGAVADIAIADCNKEYAIDVSNMKSKAKNTPFGGRKVKGKILYTIVGGKVIVENGSLKPEYEL
jgi:dihydroorotase